MDERRPAEIVERRLSTLSAGKLDKERAMASVQVRQRKWTGLYNFVTY
jgi:hypothetical protein